MQWLSFRHFTSVLSHFPSAILSATQIPICADSLVVSSILHVPGRTHNTCRHSYGPVVPPVPGTWVRGWRDCHVCLETPDSPFFYLPVLQKFSGINHYDNEHGHLNYLLCVYIRVLCLVCC